MFFKKSCVCEYGVVHVSDFMEMRRPLQGVSSLPPLYFVAVLLVSAIALDSRLGGLEILGDSCLCPILP